MAAMAESAFDSAWRREWRKVDPRGRGSVNFSELPALLDALGADLDEAELEDAAVRIQR